LEIKNALAGAQIYDDGPRRLLIELLGAFLLRPVLFDDARHLQASQQVRVAW
jgi:hypothetical protein